MVKLKGNYNGGMLAFILVSGFKFQFAHCLEMWPTNLCEPILKVTFPLRGVNKTEHV